MENKELNSAGLKLENASALKTKKLNLLKGIAKIVTNVSLKNFSTIPNNIIDTIFDSFEVSVSAIPY